MTQDEIDRILDEANKFIDRLNNRRGYYEKNYGRSFTQKEWDDFLNEARKRNITDTVTGGNSRRMRDYGNNIKNFGECLTEINKGGILGKFGDYISKAGGAVSKLSGVLGVLIEVVEIVNKVMQFHSELVKIENAKIKAFNDIALAQQGVNIQIEQTRMQTSLQAQQETGQEVIQEAQEYGKLGLEGIKLNLDAYVKANETMSKMIFNMKDAAYAAADATIDLSAGSMSFKQSSQLVSGTIDIMRSDLSASLEQMEKNFELDSQLLVDKTKLQTDYQGRVAEREYNQRISEQWGGWNDAVKTAFTGNVGGAVGDVVFNKGRQAERRANMERINENERYYMEREINEKTIYTAQEKYAVDLNKLYVSQANSLHKVNLELAKSEQDAYIDAAKNIEHAWLDMTKTLNDEFQKHETSAFKMGREMGLTGDQLQSYSKSMASTLSAVSKWGKNMEWAEKLQTVYQETTGRNIQFSNEDFETSAAIGTLVGDDIVSQLNAGMEIFNTSVADSNTQFYEMYKQVSKIGLNGKKYAKDLVNNLKLAEKYNFKGGVKSLMEMSKWAQNMRFNVNSLDGMLDKVQTDGLEGIIKQSAQLQVLGGNFAMGADPMAMAYEAYMDPEGYAKRMNGMIAGQGVFNSETGETTFGIAAQQVMRQYAESTGQDYKDVLNQARQQAKLNQIGGNLTDDFNEDQQALIANKAQYDKDTHQWYVEDMNKQRINVEDINKENIGRLGNIEDNDPEMCQVKLQQQMLNQLQSIFSTEEQMQISQEEMKAVLISTNWEKLNKVNETINKEFVKEFKDTQVTYQDEFNENLKLIASAPTKFSEIFSKGNKEVDENRDKLLQGANTLLSTISTTSQKGIVMLAKALNTQIPTVDEFGKIQMDVNEPSTDYDYEASDGDKLSTIGGWAVSGATIGAAVAGVPGAVVGGVGAGAVAAAVVYWDDIKKFGQDTWDSISKWGTNMWEGLTKRVKLFIGSLYKISKGIVEIGTVIITPIVNFAKKKLTQVWDGINNVGVGFWNSVKNVASSAWDGIKDLASSAINGLDELGHALLSSYWDDTKKLASSAWDGIKNVAVGFWNSVKNVASSAWDGINNVGVGFWNSVKNVASSAWDGIKNVAVGFWNSVKKYAFSAWDGIKECANNIWTAITSPIINAINNVMEFLNNKFGGAFTKIAEGWNDMLKAVGISVDDGIIAQNGTVTKIDSADQVMAAKDGGPIDKIMGMAQNNVQPQPMPYDSFVKENPYNRGFANNNTNQGGEIKVAPIQINFNGRIQLDGANGTTDITELITKDPNFIRSLSQMLSQEVEKKLNGGRSRDPYKP